VRAIKAIGLDIGGVDFLLEDIAESYRAIGGGICEVNAAPGFRMHVAPSEGTPRDVAAPGHRHACSRRERRRACRSRRSPARTARRPPRACWRTSPRWRLHARAHDDDGVYIDGQRTCRAT
jgi:cyanophycin synthetase